MVQLKDDFNRYFFMAAKSQSKIDEIDVSSKQVPSDVVDVCGVSQKSSKCGCMHFGAEAKWAPILPKKKGCLCNLLLIVVKNNCIHV